MKLKIAIRKDSRELASEIVDAPADGDVTAAIGRVSAVARRLHGGALQPYEIAVTEV